MKSLRSVLHIGISLLLLTIPSSRGDDVSFSSQGRVADTDYKLKSIIVSVDFTNATIEQATEALTILSKQLDPDHKGIQFVIQPEADASARPITLKLNNVPLKETLRYVCELGHVHYRVGDRFVTVSPVIETGEFLVQRTFHVDPSFVKTAEAAGIIPSTPQPPQ